MNKMHKDAVISLCWRTNKNSNEQRIWREKILWNKTRTYKRAQNWFFLFECVFLNATHSVLIGFCVRSLHCPGHTTQFLYSYFFLLLLVWCLLLLLLYLICRFLSVLLCYAFSNTSQMQTTEWMLNSGYLSIKECYDQLKKNDWSECGNSFGLDRINHIHTKCRNVQ